MAMKMERMLAVVYKVVSTEYTLLFLHVLTKIINNNLDNLVVIQNERMRKFTIHDWICRGISNRHYCIESRYLLCNVCDIIEESTDLKLTVVISILRSVLTMACHLPKSSC
jgi:hypothetical protein